MTQVARRRYLAVPAGSYPAPRPPARSGVPEAAPAVLAPDEALEYVGEPEPTLVEGMRFDDFGPGPAVAPASTLATVAAVAPGAAVATVAAPSPAAASVAPASLVPGPALPAGAQEPDLDALLSAPVSPTFASLGPDYPGSIEANDDPARTIGRGGTVAPVRPAGRWDGVLPGRMLLFAFVGAVLGAFLGYGLLILRPDSAGRLNPVILWKSAEPNMQLMTVLVVVGFALLGSALGARNSADRVSS